MFRMYVYIYVVDLQGGKLEFSDSHGSEWFSGDLAWWLGLEF